MLRGDHDRAKRWCAVVVRTSRELGVTWRNPPPQPGGRLPGRVCPVGPLSIVPRILAGGCLAPPSGRRPDGKAQSARWASRKSAVCMLGLTERRTLSPPLPQNASFREIVPPECAFPYGTGCRMRFSVECAFPHLGKRRAASRKSAFWSWCLTEKRILYVGPHGKAHSVRWASRKSAFCTLGLTQRRSLYASSRAECDFPRGQTPSRSSGIPAQPAPQPGGRLPGRVCPVGPLSIVPRILAGGCLAPPPGGDVTERRTLYASH